MKAFCVLRSATAALAASAAFAALASGTHAGGHPHEEDAVGKPGVAARATRTVKIDMTDAMRFVPGTVEVRQNETVRFVVTNSGKTRHELVLGTEEALMAHEALMKKNPGMEHEEPNMVTVAPGQTGELVWQFTRAGKVDFACLQPGHYDAGMKGRIDVARSTARVK